jgi:branched-chain amino acid transport system substrate-binding protein
MRIRRSTLRVMVSVVVMVGTIGLGAVFGSGTPAGAATASTVVIGDICSCTGPEASTISQTSDTMQAWTSWVNSHGGLGGHPVQLIIKDDGYDPGKSLIAAKDLITQSHAIALFDNSDEDASWASYVQQQHVPVLGGQETDAGYKNPDFFPPGATFNYTNPVGAIVAKQHHIKTEAALYCVEVAICAESVQGGAKIAAKYGIKYVYTAGIGFAAPNYTAECLAAKQSGAQAMVVGDASAIVNKVAQECAVQGYKPIELSSDGTVAISWLAIPAMDGNIDTQANLPWFVHSAATKTMYAALGKYAPQVPKGQNFGEVVLQSWSDGAELQAAVAAGHLSATPTSAEIVNGLYALPTGTTLGGLSPPLHFVKGQPANNSCFFIMGIKNKQFVQLNNGKTVCAPLYKPGSNGL